MAAGIEVDAFYCLFSDAKKLYHRCLYSESSRIVSHILSLPGLSHIAYQSPDFLLFAGAVYYHLFDFRESMKFNSAALSLDSRLCEALSNLGNCSRELGQTDVAIMYYRQAMETNPGFPDAYNNMGSLLVQIGRLPAAVEYFERALRLSPQWTSCRTDLGNVYRCLGQLDLARQCFEAVVMIDPSYAPAWAHLGFCYRDAGCANIATVCLVRALKTLLVGTPVDAFLSSSVFHSALTMNLDQVSSFLSSIPTISLNLIAEAASSLATLFKDMNQSSIAVELFRLAICARPQSSPLHANLAALYHSIFMLQDAAREYGLALQFADASQFPVCLRADALNNMGNALKEQGLVDQAVVCYRSSLALVPLHAHALNNLGNAYKELGLIGDALTCYQTAVRASQPVHSAAPLSNMASLLKEIGQMDQALLYYRKALEIDPNFVDAHSNYANALKDIGHVDEAVSHYQIAVTLNPQFATGFNNLASAFKDSGRVIEAISSYQRALSLKPDLHDALCNMFHAMTTVCMWENREAILQCVISVVETQLKSSVFPSMQPFHALAYPVSPELFRGVCTAYAERAKLSALQSFQLWSARHKAASCGPDAFAPLHLPTSQILQGWEGAGPSRRVRIGYVSSDFGNHPLSHLMQSVFGMHDRSRFEVFCFALNPDDNSVFRSKIAREVEHFVDVSALETESIAGLIVQHQIHILVNLNGYTKGARNEIFALQPSPIQCMYMGFPGTSGASYIQYFITDTVTTPLECERSFSEKLVRMPNSYFVCDHKQCFGALLQEEVRLLPLRNSIREQYGLPPSPHAVVLGTFNQLYKIDPQTFDTWCGILKRLPHAVLWLLRFPAAGEPFLRKYAFEKHGLSEDRIVFSDVAAKDEHIQRGLLVDVFLDTPMCNGHTTGTDILWAGTPMVTLPLQSMASRVASSLLHAMGFPEMVASSFANYADIVVDIASSPAKLDALRERMRAARLSCPLFDTVRWVRNLERSFCEMWRMYVVSKGTEFRNIDVYESSPSIYS
eukprot:ANDGO_07469.mRNA.1 putative UDP-N-acetylglucosamine--peptide N-acetylglucosaminyltransferase S2.4.1.-